MSFVLVEVNNNMVIVLDTFILYFSTDNVGGLGIMR